MDAKYYEPMVGKLLLTAAPDVGEWILEKHETLPYWTCASQRRVYVLGRHTEFEDLERIWSTLSQGGCGQFTEQNTVMLNSTSDNASFPDNIHVLPKWRPPKEGADPNGLDPALGGWLLALLDGAVPVPRYLAGEPVQKRGNTPFGPYEWVADCSEASRHVAALAADLRERPYVGVDVECHFDKVCVVQLASARHCVLLDAIALRDYMHELLQPLMMDPDVWKVFHGHVNDVAWLHQNFGVVVTPDQVCDTATYAEALDGAWDGGQPSLQTTCMTYLHYDLDKSYKTADWSQRPLSDEMLDCAAMAAQVVLPLRNACLAWESTSWEMVAASFPPCGWR